jgi:hypothetical protein
MSATFSVTKRHETSVRKAELEVEVSDVPIIQAGPELRTKGWPIQPYLARITYASYDDQPWRVRVTVYGTPLTRHTLMNGFAEYNDNGIERWPSWLRELVDRERPAAPAQPVEPAHADEGEHRG